MRCPLLHIPVLLPLATGCLLLGGLAGCATTAVDRRIGEKTAAYARLDAGQRSKIQQGVIELGFTADMVYMALGHPAKTTTRPTADGPVGIWIYDRFIPPDPRAAMTGPGMMPPGPSSLRSGSLFTGNPGAAPPALGPNAWNTESLIVLFFAGRVAEIKLAARDAPADPD